jgi:dsDNA-specific endonuclease/ATPase MutS2
MWPFRRKKIKARQRSGPLVPGEREVSAAPAGNGNGGNTPTEPAPEPIVVTDTLDLHGFFPEQVPPMIGDFIENAKELGLRSLRIVHGKGKSRLKWEVHQVLKEHPEVVSYRDAAPEAGGWGATIVLLAGPGKRT